jgi:hypothetical protein
MKRDQGRMRVSKGDERSKKQRRDERLKERRGDGEGKKERRVRENREIFIVGPATW